MEDKSLQIFLSNILNNKSVNHLLDSGLDFKGIAQLTDFAIDNGYIIVGPKEVELSKLGKEKLSELRTNRRNIPKQDWISSEDKSKIRKVTKDFIFLPKEDELP